MSYVALKPCSFAGQRFKIGDTVPDSVIQPGSINNLLAMGLIARPEGAVAPATVTHTPISIVPLSVRTDDGDLMLELTVDGLQGVVNALTSGAAAAEEFVKAIADGDALILLHLADNRKTIKAAAEARAKELSQETEDSKESAGER